MTLARDAAPGADRATLRLGLVAALSAAAWAALAIWSASPYARYLDHGGWGDPGWLAALCRSLPGGRAIPGLLYVLAWLLMIAAMMLPSTVTFLRIFGRMTDSRPDAGR